MAAINEALLIGGALLFVALLLSAASQRLGVPVLAVFLVVGLLVTEIPGAPRFPIAIETAALIGNLALAVILLDGGLRTRASTFRMVAAPALTLATVGVVLTAAVVGALAVALLGLDWRYGLLLGAIVGSTDAAAVFALLRAGGGRLNERVEATLEVESGINDPMAVFLTLLCLELIRTPQFDASDALRMLVGQAAIGAAAGLLFGRLLAAIVARLRLGESLLALLIQSGGLAIFAATALAGGSGFLAIYLAGIAIASRSGAVGENVLRASDGLAWLSQAGMFLILGIVTDVKALLPLAAPGLAIAAGLMLVARPLAVAACLLPFRYAPREVLFIGWIGLRGAVPIVLALFPLLAGVPHAATLFHVAFFCVLLSLFAQGASLRAAARWAGVVAPAVSPVLAAARLLDTASPRDLIQLRVLPGAPVVDCVPAQIEWPPQVTVVEVLRDGQQIAEGPLRAGDLVVLAAPPKAVPELEALFAEAPSAGELLLSAQATLADLRDYYGCTLPPGVPGDTSLGSFVRARLHGRPAAGDRVCLGELLLTVRAAAGGEVRRLALRLPPRRSAARQAD
ncbi:MAG: potassium/proton antiporter [Burkholderiaceae bacterium]|nr:potassium/proton antiporter [Burkholderiaceae bacterium]